MTNTETAQTYIPTSDEHGTSTQLAGGIAMTFWLISLATFGVSVLMALASISPDVDMLALAAVVFSGGVSLLVISALLGVLYDISSKLTSR